MAQELKAAELNAKLDHVRQQASSGLANQRQLSLVLTSVEDNLEEQGSAKTPAAYFISFLALLDENFREDEVVNPELAIATAYFLDLVFPYTPATLLRSKFAQILAKLAPAISHKDSQAPLIRSSIGALESLLIAQDTTSWNQSPGEISPRRAVMGLLELAIDPRPKVRKRAQEAISNVLKNIPAGPSSEHPAAQMCAETSLRLLHSLLNQGSRSKNNETRTKNTIHCLQLITAITSVNGWPSSLIDKLFNVLLRISKTTDHFLISASFNAFEGLFKSMSDEVDMDKLDKAADVIYTLQPSVNDAQLAAAWLAIIAQIGQSYNLISHLTGLQKLPTVFAKVVPFFKSENKNIYESAAQCLIALISTNIPDDLLLLPGKKSDDSSISHKDYEKVEEVLAELAEMLAELLKLDYLHCLSQVLDVLYAFISKLRFRANPHALELVETVGNLRSDEAFELRDEADRVLGAAINSLGPEVVIGMLPLNLEKQTAKRPGRAWMLPLLRDHIQCANLGHFVSYFMPLVDQLNKHLPQDGRKDESLHTKIYQTLIEQIWSLLPKYCDLPLDLQEAFTNSFAEALANALYTKVELRPVVCQALKLIVESNVAYSDGAAQEDLLLQQRFPAVQSKRNVTYLAGFASNILAVLFNVYSQTAPEFRGYILEPINGFLSISSPEDLTTTFNRICQLLNTALEEEEAAPAAQPANGKGSAQMSVTLMDLVVVIAVYLPKECHSTLFSIFTKTVNSRNGLTQKRAYRIVSRLIDAPDGEASVKENLEALEQLLVESAPSVVAASRAARLHTLQCLVELLPSEDLHFIPSVLPETIISTKDVNEKSRSAAFSLLVAMAGKMSQGGTVKNSKVPHMDPEAADTAASIEEFLTMVSAGLVGEPHMQSATIIALSRVVFEFRAEIRQETLLEVCQTVELFLTSNNREIVKSTLGFVKIAAVSLPPEIVQRDLRQLLENLLVWSHEHKGHFKAKVKHIIERLIRRFGLDVISANFPEEDRKLLTNIRKTKERQKRRKETEPEQEEGTVKDTKRKFASAYEQALYGESSDEEDGEEMDEDETPRRGAGRGKGANTYIVESKEDPLNLLDQRSLAHLTSSRPDKGKKDHSRASQFQTQDGKFVFDDEEPEDPYAQSEDAFSAYVQAVKSGPVRGQRGRLKYQRGRRAAADDDDDGDDGAERPGRRDRGDRGDRRDRGDRGRNGAARGSNREKLAGVKRGSYAVKKTKFKARKKL